MKPLSTLNFFRHNKRKLVSNLLIIIVAICLVYILECFVASFIQSIYPLDSRRFHYCSVMVSTEAVPEIPAEWIREIEERDYTEKAVPAVMKQFVFSVPGSTTHSAVFSFSEEDESYIFQKFGVEVVEGRMPVKGTDEIALDENIAKNNHLKIGDQTEIDKAYNMDRCYTVVGILKNDSHISLVGAPEVNSEQLKYDEKGYLIFPKQGCQEQVEQKVTTYSKKGLTIWTLTLYNKLFNKNNQTFKILDAMVILAILVMVVCLCCSKYAQYFSRKREIGTLYALGYTQTEITNRLTNEVVFTNLLGFVIGLILAVVLSKTLLANYFVSIGGAGVYLNLKAAWLSLLAPLFTTVFTLIPVYRLIQRVDAITIVESN